jgi:hypothetical protein
MVNAVNSHDELVEALEMFVDPITEQIYMEFHKILKVTERRKIEAALKKAKP